LRFYAAGVIGRCVLVYALALRWDDGAVVLDVSSGEEQALLNNPGPLAGWELSPADPRLWWQRRTA
jgi:hypothetical protein